MISLRLQKEHYRVLPKNKIEMASYYELTAIYQTLSRGDTGFFEKNKIGFLSILLKFLQKNKSRKKIWNSYSSHLMQEEKLAAECSDSD